MKALTLITALLLGSGATAVSASVLTVGGSYARSCYLAAEARDGRGDSLDSCDLALTVQALSAEDRVATHVNRGIRRTIRQDNKGATADFDAALAMNPRQPEAWLNKGVVLLNQGQTKAAGQMAEKAMQLRTRKPALALYIRAVANEDAGQVKAAYSDFVQAAQLDPDWSLPQRELKRYKIVR